jgi:hypothetical protein
MVVVNAQQFGINSNNLLNGKAEIDRQKNNWSI